MKCILTLIAVFGITFSGAQTSIVVEYDLGSLNKQSLAVKVIPPQITNDTLEWIIPQIVPGTYMRINYKRYYQGIVFYDKQGKKIRHKQKNNRFIIYKGKSLGAITYRVRESFGSRKVWDNIIPCAGSIFTKDAFLINYQMITGYFNHYEQVPFEIRVTHPPHLYAATSQEVVQRAANKDVFTAANYAELIDRPLMYSIPDTVSFTSGGTRFHIALHTDYKKITGDSLLLPLQKIMDSLYHFMGSFNMKEYHFLLFFVNYDTLNSSRKFALNGALEHRHSYVFTFRDIETMSTFIPRLNYFTAHEFLHTWAPLAIHSEKIDNFDFSRPDMSAHLWLYEGMTDYCANLFCRQYGLSFYEGMAMSFSFAEARKERSLTESSRNIISSNMFTWISKMLQLANTYERGQVVGFCLDMELLRLSKDTFRLRDLMARLNERYQPGNPFPEDNLFQIMASLSYPEVEPFLQKYVAGKELPPYQGYLDLLGWRYIAKGESVPSFGEFTFGYVANTDTIYEKKGKKNTLGLKKGDKIAYKEYEPIYRKLFTPYTGDTLSVTVWRNNDTLRLTGTATMAKKTTEPKIYIKSYSRATPEQRHYRQLYYFKRRE
jgi:predicted metalloprotease with PDZ domain